jgi:DNA-binding GntR family transcriptional regulator
MSPTLKERAYGYIRDKLLLGEIPTGQRLSDAEIARELGISRTPVREAIVHLEAQGLVEQQPGVGPLIKVLDRRELEELFELREVLECGAATAAAQRVTDTELAGLEAVLDEYEAVMARVREAGADKPAAPPAYRRTALLDMTFHLKIIEAAKNRSLLRMVRDTQLLTRVFQRRGEAAGASVPLLQRLERICTDHRAILSALRQRDAERLRQSLQGHLEWSRERNLEVFDWEQRQKASASSGGAVDMYYPTELLETLRRADEGPDQPRKAMKDQRT